MEPMKKFYGKELILDLHKCDASLFTRESLKQYFKELCALIDMKREKLVWWDDLGLPLEEQEVEPHLKGTTAIQFIKTSNITIHTLDIMKHAYINIFSCKDFDPEAAEDFTKKWFKGQVIHSEVINREKRKF